MPELLANITVDAPTVFHYKGILSPPKSFQDWQDFMTAFGSALLDRYGLEEVSQWYFEVWNEPNCCGGYPYSGCCGPACGDQQISHLYPTDPWAHEDALSHGRDDFYHAIKEASDIVEASSLKHGMKVAPPFVLTEFNCQQPYEFDQAFGTRSFNGIPKP
eukprot:gene19875-29357_t